MGLTGGGNRNGARFSYLSDNTLILNLEGKEETHRTIRVMKARATAHDPKVRRLSINSDGVAVI